MKQMGYHCAPSPKKKKENCVYERPDSDSDGGIQQSRDHEGMTACMMCERVKW